MVGSKHTWERWHPAARPPRQYPELPYGFHHAAALLFQRSAHAQSHMPLCNLFSCVSFLPLGIVKHKARIQILIQQVCGQVFWVLLSLALGLLPNSSDFCVAWGMSSWPGCARS